MSLPTNFFIGRGGGGASWDGVRDTLLAYSAWSLIDSNTIETDYSQLRSTQNTIGINGISSSEIGGIGGGYFDIPWDGTLNGVLTFEIHGAQGGRGIRDGNVGQGGAGGRTFGTLNLGAQTYIRLVVGGGGEGDAGQSNVGGGGGGQSCIIVPNYSSGGWHSRIVVSGGGGGGGAGTGGSAAGGAGGGANQDGIQGAGNQPANSQWGSGGGVSGSPIGGQDVRYHGSFGYTQNGNPAGPLNHSQQRAFGGGGLGPEYESGGGGGGWYGGGVANYGNYGGSGGGGAGYAVTSLFNVTSRDRSGTTTTDADRGNSGYMKLTFTG